MAKFCSECGAALVSGAKFCGECGTSVGLGSEHLFTQQTSVVREAPFAPQNHQSPPMVTEEWLDEDEENWRPESAPPPPEVLRYLRQDARSWVRCLVASQDRTPLDTLRELAFDHDEDVRIAVAGNANLPSGQLSELAHDPDECVRAAVAENPHTSPMILALLADDDVALVNSAVAGNPNTPREAQRTLAFWDSMPSTALRELAGDLDSDVRWMVAGNSSTPPDVLVQLAADPEDSVRAGVAGNDVCPPDVLVQLAADPEEWVRRVVAENSSAPPEALAALASNSGERDSWVIEDVSEIDRYEVAGRSDAPADVLEKLATDEGLGVRAEVAGNDACPPDVLRILISDPDAWVRECAVSNKNLPIDALVNLAIDHDPSVMNAARGHPRARSGPGLRAWQLCEKYLDSREAREQVSDEIRGMSAADADLLRILANAGPPGLRLVAAENPATPSGAPEYVTADRGEDTDTTRQLLSRVAEGSDGRDEVMAKVRLMNANDANVLRVLAHDGPEGLRRAVARNPHTPPDVLAMLADDPISTVRFFANQTLAGR